MRLGDLRGRVGLGEFWATWCEPCREDVRVLNEVQDRLGDNRVVVLAVATADSGGEEVIRDFGEREHVRYTLLADDGRVADAYGIETLPTRFLVDRRGAVRRMRVGVASDPQLLQELRGLMRH